MISDTIEHRDWIIELDILAILEVQLKAFWEAFWQHTPYAICV
jgi:hypothetical protein